MKPAACVSEARAVFREAVARVLRSIRPMTKRSPNDTAQPALPLDLPLRLGDAPNLRPAAGSATREIVEIRIWPTIATRTDTCRRGRWLLKERKQCDSHLHA